MYCKKNKLCPILMHKLQLKFSLSGSISFFKNFVVNNYLLFFSYQQAIEEVTRQMGAGMANFICKEVCYISPSKYKAYSLY
jgi:hypothetical protein